MPLLGPGDNLPSSSPRSSASAARGVYGKADRGGGGLRNSSYVAGAVGSKKAEALGRREKYARGITECKIYCNAETSFEWMKISNLHKIFRHLRVQLRLLQKQNC
jgi:hypothetical protein